MAHEIYYQSVGNPLQWDRLPNRRPDIHLPLRSDSPGRDVSLALKLLLLFAVLSLLGLFAQAMHSRSELGSEDPSLIWNNSLLLLIGIVLIAMAVQERSTRWLKLPLECLVAAFLCLNLPIPFTGQMLVAGAVLGLFTWLLATHWTAFCTASPTDRETAVRLHHCWIAYLALAALVPNGIVLLLRFAPGPLVPRLLVAILAFQIVAAASLPAPRGRFRSAWRALVSWLTYNRFDVDLPGIFQSPTGTWLQRMAVTALCVFLISATYFRGQREAINALAQSSNPSPAVVSTASLFLWPRLSTSPMSFDGAMLHLAFSLVTFAIPFAIVVITPLVLALPVLVQANSHHTSEVTADSWRNVIDEIGQSTDPIERQSLYMGRIAQDGSPLLVPRELFGEHAHFLGDSGAGKTSLGLLPLLEQIGTPGDCSIIVIDLKADSMELLGTLTAVVEEARRRTGRQVPLKHFSNQVGRSTFAFNPLLQPYWRDLELYMRTDIQCGALGLTYGADYGEGYYSSANAAVLYHTIKTFPDVVTYKELADRVGYVVANAKRSELHPEIRKAGVHVQTVLDRLGSFEALNVTPDEGYSTDVVTDAIDFTNVFTQPEVHYFHLSSTLAPGSSPEIARLVTYSLLAAATQVERRHQVFLVIDEFQRMVARNIEYMLQLARSMGVGVILANQTMEDLRTSTANLIPAIEANCRYRQWFAVSSDDDRRRLIDGSGQGVDYRISKSYRNGPKGDVETVTYQECIVPRLDVNHILLASDHPRQSIVRISRGAGYAQYGGMPFILESNYHISQKQYEQRKATPWPEHAVGSFAPGRNTRPALPTPTAGPVVTTEVVGAAPDTADAAADLFDSFLQSSEPNPPRRRRSSGRKRK